MRRRDKARTAERGVAPGRDRFNDPPGEPRAVRGVCRSPHRHQYLYLARSSSTRLPVGSSASLSGSPGSEEGLLFDYSGVLNWGIFGRVGRPSQREGVTQGAVDALA